MGDFEIVFYSCSFINFNLDSAFLSFSVISESFPKKFDKVKLDDLPVIEGD